MTEFMEHLVLITVVIIPIGIWLFELYYSRWHKEKDSKKRETYSRIWHAVKFWTIFLPAILIFIIAGLTTWFRYLPLMLTLGMIFFDLFWNWQNKPPGGLLYPGNGKGGFIELIIFRLSKKIGLNFTITMLLTKLACLLLSILIIIIF